MNQQFDIFLSHNSKDKAAIREIKQLLRERELSCWLDEDELQPGVNWMPLLQKAIATCQSAGAFVSNNGIGPWEDEEVQALLTKAVRNKIPVIPVLLPGDYDAPELPLFLGNRTFIDMRSGITSVLIDKLYWGITGKKPEAPQKTQTSIHSDRLPTVKGGFFGRTAELQLLNDAWANTTTRIIQFIAPGGTGKTKLLRHWLDRTTDIPVLIAWSFYSQGSSEDKQISATPFFSHVFGVLKSEKTQFSTEEEKGEHLAHLLRQRRCLLVLDGLEPLQHAGRGMRGELKDRAIRQLLKSLAGEHNSLCIITTRLAVHEISGRAHVISHDLQNLAPDDGVSLLKSWEVYGSDSELEKAVHEYGCHALALHLLGNALHTYLDGDVRKRDTLSELIDDYDDIGRHAFKVMQAYSRWLVDDTGKPTAELQLLHLLGLFDHPIETDVLQVLWQAQVPYLTAGIPEKAWKVAIRDLREKHRMLSAHEGRPDLLDCHPLIREYFGGQLQTQQPQAWQQAHERLYEYYKALPEKLYGKFLPDTLEEMQPLFSAVAHGCAAGLHQQALEEVYWPRVQRKNEAYIFRRLGASSDNLSIIAHFFITFWHSPVTSLKSNSMVVLNWAGFNLSVLGRLREALEPMQVSFGMMVKQEYWIGASISASNLSGLQIILGDLAQAVESGACSSNYADRSGDLTCRVAFRSTHADALHHVGNTATALALFQEAEQLQRKWQPFHTCLYSLQGFRYCDLLLELGRTMEALERAESALKFVLNNSKNVLDIALNQLTLGRAYLQQFLTPHPSLLPQGEREQDQQQAAYWLGQAVVGLRAAGQQQYLPLGLLSHAALHRHTRNFDHARADLQEVFDIADGSGMRLHLTDYHLEMARLLVAESLAPCPPCGGRVGEGGNSHAAADPAYHITAAERLINETGYHRRDGELADLKTKIST